MEDMTIKEKFVKRMLPPADIVRILEVHETQNPDQFVTEICYPVKKK